MKLADRCKLEGVEVPSIDEIEKVIMNREQTPTMAEGKKLAIAIHRRIFNLQVPAPLTREEFRHIMCEFKPTITEDSGQPEWTQGELDMVWDFITGKKKCILTHREEPSERLENIEEIASFLHTEYEKQAEIAGWETQEYCRVEFKNLPNANKKVMYAVAQAIYAKFGKVELGFCKVCWTSSWAPCPKDHPHAQKVKNKDEYVICQMCQADRRLFGTPKESLSISQCPNCFCMTKNVCGKCGKVKGEI